jgi:predicted enzyme related to lactoylglutathione lyase
MAEGATVRTYPQGVTSWIDVSAPDPDGAEAFYGELLGWTFETMTPPGVPRYAIGRLDGQDAGGLAEVGGPGVWSTYIAVDDIVAAVAGIVDAGGVLLDPPEAGGEGGWSAICADPAGVEFRLWQAKNRPGVQAVNRPGAWNFSDLHTDDPHGADFYERVFGWVVDRQDEVTFIRVPGYGDHLAATVDPDIHERQASAPPGFADVIGGVAATGRGLAPHWHVVFTVADRDDAVERAERSGAKVLGTSQDRWTSKAMVRDPYGAIFTVSQFTPPDGSSFDTTG